MVWALDTIKNSLIIFFIIIKRYISLSNVII